MAWLTALIAGLVEGLLRLVLAVKKEADAEKAQVDRGRSEVVTETREIVAEVADAQAHVNQEPSF